MKFLRDLFAIAEAIPESDLDRVEAVLDHLEPNEAKKIAASALLMGRVAYADLEISDSERQKMSEILVQELQVSEDDAKAVAELAVEKTLATSLDQHIVIRAVNDFSDYEFKKKLMYCLFLLAADEGVSVTEQSQLKQIGNALHIQQPDYIAVTARFREHLDVLKRR